MADITVDMEPLTLMPFVAARHSSAGSTQTQDQARMPKKTLVNGGRRKSMKRWEGKSQGGGSIRASC